MATKTVRTPTKVRANREAVIEYFDAMKQEPVKDGSTLQQTPSGLHFKLPTKRLVYESDHYAVFDNEESASSQSDDASFHSLRGQESIEAPQGFYYGTENESQRYNGGREHQQTASSSGLQDRRYSNSQRSTSDNRDPTFTTQQDSRHCRMPGASQTYHYRGGTREKSTASICTPDEKLRSGPAGMQQQASTFVEQSKVDGGQHRTTTSSHSQGGWQSAQHGSQHATQYNQKQGGVSGTADLGHLYGYVDDKRADRKGEEAKYEEDILRKGFEEMMKEAVSSTKEINQFLYDLWRTQRMCDITIKVNEKEFHAHKLALAAHSEKFTNRYCEEAPSTVTEVILPDATPEATEALINYIYTNELTLTAENIESIIVCARQLGIKSALNFCQDFLYSFNEDSVLFLLPIAQRQGFTEVAERMFGFINKSSLVMLQSVGFLQCEVHQVEWMISRDELVVSTELEVFMAVLRWINHNQSDRIKYAPMLIGCVRLIYISPEDLVKHVEPETHIFNIQKCFEMLYFAFR